jgi:hypothetical protein
MNESFLLLFFKKEALSAVLTVAVTPQGFSAHAYRDTRCA